MDVSYRGNPPVEGPSRNVQYRCGTADECWTGFLLMKCIYSVADDAWQAEGQWKGKKRRVRRASARLLRWIPLCES